MCVQEGNLLYMWETDLGYLWLPNGKQVSRLEVATLWITPRPGLSRLYTTSSVCLFSYSTFDTGSCSRVLRPQ